MPRRRRTGGPAAAPPPELLRFDPADWPGGVLPQYEDHHPEAAAILSAFARWSQARQDFAGPDLSGWPWHQQIEDLFVQQRLTHQRVHGWVRATYGWPLRSAHDGGAES